jgi:type II secretion system protein G
MHSLKLKRQQGFTIVELLIVIVVIGILAGLVIVTYNGIQQKARNTERTTDISALQSHLEAYFAQNNGTYPTLDNLNTQPATGNWWIQDNMKGLSKEALRDPKSASYSLASTPTTNQYAYQPTDDSGNACDNSTTNCTKYTLTAKQEGGSDIVKTSLN